MPWPKTEARRRRGYAATGRGVVEYGQQTEQPLKRSPHRSFQDLIIESPCRRLPAEWRSIGEIVDTIVERFGRRS